MNEDLLAQFTELKKALEAERVQLQERLAAINEVLGESVTSLPAKRRGRPPKNEGIPGEAPVRRKRQLSEEARARIVAAQKARWARKKETAAV